jgi:hypothetical protein
MEVSNMLDVLHYLLDEDLSYSSGDEAKYKSAVRASIYKNLYEKNYKYKLLDNNSSSDFSEYDDADAGISREVKPYIPPTAFNPESPNPFQGALRERPLG